MDMCRTTLNVTGDAAVSMMVAKSGNKFGDQESDKDKDAPSTAHSKPEPENVFQN